MMSGMKAIHLITSMLVFSPFPSIMQILRKCKTDNTYESGIRKTTMILM
jgi:hypothetical protein